MKSEGKERGRKHTCRYSFGTPFPIKCPCLASTASTLANFVVAESPSIKAFSSPSSSSCIGVMRLSAGMVAGSAIAFCLNAPSASFSSKKSKPASSILRITAEELGESIRSEVSSRRRRRDEETMSRSSPSGVAAMPDSARTMASSERGGRMYGSQILVGLVWLAYMWGFVMGLPRGEAIVIAIVI